MLEVNAFDFGELDQAEQGIITQAIPRVLLIPAELIQAVLKFCRSLHQPVELIQVPPTLHRTLMNNGEVSSCDPYVPPVYVPCSVSNLNGLPIRRVLGLGVTER